MHLCNRYLKVQELTDNLEVDGIVKKYDDTSPFMFAKIIALDTNCRIAKEFPALLKWLLKDNSKLNKLIKSLN